MYFHTDYYDGKEDNETEILSLILRVIAHVRRVPLLSSIHEHPDDIQDLTSN